MYSHFSISAVRRERLKKFVAAVGGEWHELKRHVKARWLSFSPCINNILLNWKAITNYFKSVSDDCPVHIKNILMFEEIEGDNVIQTYLQFASHMLHVFHKTII